MDLLTVGLSSAAFVLFLITGAILCLCCYKWMKQEKHQSKKLDNEGYYSLAPPKAQHESKWKPRSVKLKGQPEKVVETHGIQPSHYSQATLNESLGAVGKVGTSGQETSEQPHPLQSAIQELLNPFESSDSTKASPIDPKLGRVEISLRYDPATETLTLKILRGVDLPAKDASGTSDPYVKVLLLPDKKHKLTTKIKRKKLNPRWNETFLFEGFKYSQLLERTLYLQVLDYDRFSRDDPIGEVYLPLASMDLLQSQDVWMDLQPCVGHKGKLGELLISLCYEPTLGKLTVVIMKARGLKSKDINGYSDPYVKVWLCKHDKREEKRKTAIKERNLNPVYNESFVFNVNFAEIRHTSLRISVMDYDAVGRNEKIGELLLGSRSAAMEMKHWNEMFTKPRQPVAQWHMLKILK